MKKNVYTKPMVVMIEGCLTQMMAASGVDAYSNERGSGEVFVNERRGDWGDLWSDGAE